MATKALVAGEEAPKAKVSCRYKNEFNPSVAVVISNQIFAGASVVWDLLRQSGLKGTFKMLRK